MEISKGCGPGIKLEFPELRVRPWRLIIKREIARNFLLLQQFSNSDIIVVNPNPQLYIARSYLPPYDTLEQDLTPIGSF